MRDYIRARATQYLVSANPQGTLDQILRLLVSTARGVTGGLFSIRESDRRLALLSGYGLGPADLRQLTAWWAETGCTMADQEVSERGGWCVCGFDVGPFRPLIIYVSGAPRFAGVRTLEAIGHLSDYIATAVSGPCVAPSPEVDIYLATAPEEAIARRQMELALEASEWNVAQAARRLGVSRVTVYARLRRWGIERIRLRKSPGAEA